MMKTPELSLASYSFHGLHAAGMIDVFNYLNVTKFRYRINQADIWSGFIPTADEAFIGKIKTALTENEMTLANLCVDGAHVWEPDPEIRKENAKRAADFIRIGETLGAKTIRIDTGGREATWTEEEFDAIVTQYRIWAHRAGEMGYRIGTENHWGATQRPANVVKLAKAVDHPAFGVLFHFGNIQDFDVDAGNDMLVPYAMHTHIAAVVADSCGPLLGKLIDAGYQGTFSCEHHTGRNEYTQVEWQIGAIRRTLALLLDARAEGKNT